MKRTNEQKQAFVDECLRIEKAGGNVQEYIAQNWPSYTPRATWYNLQKQFLGRRLGNLTEGKPKGGDNMSKMLEMAKKAMEAADAGEDVFDYLEKAGYKNPSSTWYMLKQQAKKHDPDLYERMANAVTGHRKPNPAPKKKKPVDNSVIGQKDAETVFFGGKPYEKMEKAEQNAPKTEQNTGDHISAEDYRKMSGEIPAQERKPVIHCAPGPYRAVEVPDELPEQLPVCAVKSKVKGEWHLSGVEGCVHLIWEDRMTHEERSLGLPADDWKKLANEIPVMLKQLGLTK